ncbi:hypothetical protein LO772_31975 [Yinghuangia sp. ASG 101]|nr:hypothetical protein [Yinghuangia sp. ASG 101]UGQ11362.1 hypothetical protein LO772_31975 [Yinghuangia sp. ASG 101]
MAPRACTTKSDQDWEDWVEYWADSLRELRDHSLEAARAGRTVISCPDT